MMLRKYSQEPIIIIFHRLPFNMLMCVPFIMNKKTYMTLFKKGSASQHTVYLLWCAEVRWASP